METGGRLLAAVRHPSGAWSFHRPEAGLRGAAGVRRFRIPLRPVAERRGPLARIFRVLLLRFAARVAEAALPALASAWEARAWKRRGLAVGWKRVTREGLRSGKLPPAGADALGASGRCLLLIHGTFSEAARAFRALGRGDFLDRVHSLYGGRVFAFDHWTVGTGPEANAAALVAALPKGGLDCDALTHSRGGLVLRLACEGGRRSRLHVRRAVLCAAPNQGTPLASPLRWRETLGWLASLLDLLPDDPFGFAADLVSEGLLWLATRATGRLPGLAAMDPEGATVVRLQSRPDPGVGYAALVASCAAREPLWLRMVDAGIDGFFAGANDLVVPTEGGWRLRRGGGVPADRIAAFGPGGNVPASDGAHHLNLFEQPATPSLLLRALEGRPLDLPCVDLARPLPDRRLLRALGSPPALAHAQEAPPPAPLPPQKPSSRERDTEALELTVLPPASGDRRAQLLARWRGARVLEPFVTRGGAAGRRWFEIIRRHERLLRLLDGRSGGALPAGDELLEWGHLLFEALLPGDARRLYDAAREATPRGERLDLVFTSMIHWVADKPWELAWDPVRRAFLASEDVHFVRNALTAIPAEVPRPRRGPLRLLVALAQPIGTGALSAADEAALVERGFAPLASTGLLEVETLSRATPEALHAALARPRDVLHFVGHGRFDERAGHGSLLFEDASGHVRAVGERALRELLCGRGLRLVFLNACETGRGGRADFNRGVAPALVAAGLPAVVANQYRVLDPSATAFAAQLYASLARGTPLAAAAREARVALRYAVAGESIDWAVPVVYAHAPRMRLCRPSGAAPRTRRSARRRALRVAVADLGVAFPGLGPELGRLEGAQKVIGFALAPAPAPLGTWSRSAGGTAPVEAPLLARRLSGRAASLGADLLVAVTRQPLREGRRTLSAFWPDVPDAAIALVSLDSLEALAPALAGAIAGAHCGLPLHAGAPRCPLHAAAGSPPWRFDARCRQRLARAAPRLGEALEALLSLSPPAAPPPGPGGRPAARAGQRRGASQPAARGPRRRS